MSNTPRTDGRVVLLGRTTRGLSEWIVALGQPAYRGRQIADWIYRKGARRFEEMTNLPAALRQRLESLAVVGRNEVAAIRRSSDDTVKSLLRLADGETIETVYLPQRDYDTGCISSQAGCPAACSFCATGSMGFRRNLTTAEMLDQVLHDIDRSADHHRGDRSRLTHIVIMGMGEPLVNYNPVVGVIRMMNEEIGIGMRGITLSTVGIVPGIRRLAAERLQITLSVSLHAPNQNLREQLVPVARTWPLEELMDACRQYREITGRRVTYEYVLLAGINDSPTHASELASLLRGDASHVNLIPYNPGPGLSAYRTPSNNVLHRFERALQEAGVPATLRQPRGRDVEGACGQLYQVVAKSDRGLARIQSKPADNNRRNAGDDSPSGADGSRYADSTGSGREIVI